MALKDVVKVNRRTYFNPRAWLGYDNLKAQTRFLYDFIRTLLLPETPVREETFEQAMERLNLNEEDIKSTELNYFIFSIIFLALAILVLIFGFYLLFSHNSILGWLISFATTSLLLVQAFRYNFWYFQIKVRKLGCTFEEWKRGKPFDDAERPNQ